MATPDPANVQPWYLRNVNQALALDETTGNVYLRTGVNGDIIIEGPVTIPGEITAAQGTTPWEISGNLVNDGKPWNLQVAQGEIAGILGLSISGYGPTIGTTFQPAWELGAYTFLNSAQQLRCWSESSSDTDVSVLISGLDSNYATQTETVTLTNGTTGVLTTKNFLRVNSLTITRTPQNVGNLHVGTSDKSNTLAYIGNINDGSIGRSQMTVYTVPAGYTFYLTQSNWHTNQTGSGTALYRSWTRGINGVINVVLTFPMQQQYNSTKVVPRPYPEKTDIQWQVASSSGTSRIGGQIEGYLIANS